MASADEAAITPHSHLSTPVNLHLFSSNSAVGLQSSFQYCSDNQKNRVKMKIKKREQAVNRIILLPFTLYFHVTFVLCNVLLPPYYMRTMDQDGR